MTTEIALTSSSSGLPQSSAFDNIDGMLKFIEALGPVLCASGAAGVKTPSEGKLMALACLTERKNPFEINREFHLMDGKLSMRADATLAKFRSIGGIFKWVKDGTDGEAIIHLEYEGNSIDSKYTMGMAKQAKLIKSGGGWEKNPSQMLRARAITDGVRMIAPEVNAGRYTPEEIEDFRDDEPVVLRTSSDVEARKKELDALREVEPGQEVIDVVVEPAKPKPKPAKAKSAKAKRAEKKVEEVPKEEVVAEIVEPEPEQTERWIIDTEITAVLDGQGQTVKEFEEKLRKANPSFKSIAALSDESAKKLLENLRSTMGK